MTRPELDCGKAPGMEVEPGIYTGCAAKTVTFPYCWSTCNCFNSPASLPGRPVTYKSHRRLRSGKSYAPHGKDMKMAREMLKRQFGHEALAQPVAIKIKAYGVDTTTTALQKTDVALKGIKCVRAPFTKPTATSSRPRQDSSPQPQMSTT